MPQLHNHKPVCPEMLKPLKLKLQNLYQQALSLWQSYRSSRPEMFANDEWVSWSTPDELLNQVWEWSPLGNLRMFTQLWFPYYPLYLTQIILIIMLITLCLFSAFYLKCLYQQKYAYHQDKELFVLKYSAQEYTTPHKIIYPSPNYP